MKRAALQQASAERTARECEAADDKNIVFVVALFWM
jgi:hypothetical protein